MKKRKAIARRPQRAAETPPAPAVSEVAPEAPAVQVPQEAAGGPSPAVTPGPAEEWEGEGPIVPEAVGYWEGETSNFTLERAKEWQERRLTSRERLFKGRR